MDKTHTLAWRQREWLRVMDMERIRAMHARATRAILAEWREDYHETDEDVANDMNAIDNQAYLGHKRLAGVA